MALIIQKFGGTSVQTPESRSAVLDHIKECKNQGNDVVVVVSAMGRKGDPYATDTLIDLLVQINKEIDPRTKDLVMSCGETISCAVVSHLLNSNGIPAVALTGYQAGILTDHNFNNSEIIDIDTDIINKHLEEDKVIVLTGFQGVTIDGSITTLGRGGSDTSAVAIGGFLKADRVDIFTDVPGIAIVDPRILPAASYLKSISYAKMYQLAFHGAKVIHPRAVKLAQKFNIPLRVRSTFTKDLGTLICESDAEDNKKIIGISLDKNISCLRIDKSDSENVKLITGFSQLLRDTLTILCKEDSDFFEAYYNQDLLPPYILLPSDTECGGIEGLGRISIFMHSDNENDLQSKLKELFIDEESPLGVFYLNHCVSIILPVNKMTEYVERIYNLCA